MKCRLIFALSIYGFIITHMTAGNFSDTLNFGQKVSKPRQLLLFSAGYRAPLYQGNIINSGHGLYMEGGINVGGFISKNLVFGLYGGYALQDRLWSTSFDEHFSSDYYASINKERHFSALDSAIIYSSADLFKKARGKDGVMPGCATQSFHNYSLYYGIVFRLPLKYSPVLKLYRGSTRSHYQGDGDLVTKHRSYNNFELRRNVTGCELGVTKTFFEKRNSLGISIYFENSNFYNSTLYFDDGSVTRNITLKSFVSDSFLKKYQNEFCGGIKLFFSIL